MKRDRRKLCNIQPAAFARRLAAACLILLSVGVACPSRAQAPVDVDLQLVLAVDASGSVSQDRFELQMRGYAAAFRDPAVVNAIRANAAGAIAVTMFQWTGPELQVHAVPWTLVRDPASANAFAAAIEAAPRQLFGGGTSISGAIDYAMALLPQIGFRPLKRVIDISGDGANNRGRPASQARDDAVKSGVIINGLPIIVFDPSLDRYYFDNVIGGPGSFVIAAESYETFAAAVRRKLIQEIAGGRDPRFARQE